MAGEADVAMVTRTAPSGSFRVGGRWGSGPQQPINGPDGAVRVTIATSASPAFWCNYRLARRRSLSRRRTYLRLIPAAQIDAAVLLWGAAILHMNFEIVEGFRGPEVRA